MTLLPTAATLFEKLPRSLRRHRLMTAWMSLTGEPRLQLVRIRDDAFGYADLSEGFLRLIVIDGDFEHDFFRIADACLSDGGDVLDVGANLGLLSFGLAHKHQHHARFHLFEPNPELWPALQATRALYPLMNATITAAAVGDEPGTLKLSITPGHAGTSHISGGGTTPVPCVTLDGYLQERGITRVALMKMDVEGYELVALRGAAGALRAHAIDAIYFEYFEKNLARVQPPRQLLEFLESMGYAICLCREFDLDQAGGATHTIARGLPGHGLPLRRVTAAEAPGMTDLLAVPGERTVASI